ncbi:hypothetical protein CTI12_AA027480 [Artemisia annua]|uniref:DUF8040 domain-containing protein n=1 Tax=Artemisia annua TaxID=35608 RepID=A0A2U1QHY5_ARTAN|nr:hypothetical protein CTI12_AA027480 [Artemisia annua]
MTVAMTGGTETFYILSVMIRCFRLGCLIINHVLESNKLRKSIEFGNRHANMWSMVYQSDIMSVVNIRMNRRAFTRLCELLETRGGLRNSKHMLVDVQVAMFLHTLAHNEKNKIIVNRFQRSGETITRYFKLVLDAVCRLHKDFYKIPVRVPDNETDERWKWFKGCLGALDRTYIKVRVQTESRKPYRTRKAEICTNVLGVCTRDLMITYVLAGLEGSTADSRVIRDAISRLQPFLFSFYSLLVQGCLGALDRTYIKVRVQTESRKPYLTRKAEICTNVLGVCTRDLMITYVLAGLEGSAADSRVIRDAISRPKRP